MGINPNWFAQHVWIMWLCFGGSVVFALLAVRKWWELQRKLLIHQAWWGKGPSSGDYVDVMAIVEPAVGNSKTLKIRAADHVLGSHYPGFPKHLKVQYSYGAIKRKWVVTEHNDWLLLPEAND